MMRFPNKIIQYLKPLYKTKVEYIKSELEAYAEVFHIEQDSSERPNWYKGCRLYTVPPNDIRYDETISPLRNLIEHLDVLKKLNCNAIYILPFLESPMVDNGFDVSNFYNVRKELGTMKDMIDFKSAANKAKIHRFMDLVLNHVSECHDWFKKAQAGEEAYRNYFIYSQEKPHFIRKFEENNIVMAEYEVENKKIKLDIAFPEFAGPIPHWRQGSDKYWYYHTYYPQQPDLNWLNPDIFIEFGKIAMYWASLGFNFRLDAIPYIGKSAYKTLGVDENVTTYQIIAALKCIIDKVHPNGAILVESFEDLPTTLKYFGTSKNEKVQLVYNFHLCTHLWASLVKQDSHYIWDILDKEKKIPSHGQWVNFLRNHDELSLAHISTELRREIYDTLIKNGADFREGHGVSGRTFNLLGQDYARFNMAYFLLASLPGSLMIPYGDEIARGNISLKDIDKDKKKDTRYINRGLLSGDDYSSRVGIDVMRYLMKIFKKRSKLSDYFNNWPVFSKKEKSIYAAYFKNGRQRLYVFINLSSKTQAIKQNLSRLKPVITVNKVKNNDQALTLGSYAGIWLTTQKNNK